MENNTDKQSKIYTDSQSVSKTEIPTMKNEQGKTES
jgi:hypothetical protein